jgi:transposase-like protein
MKYQKKYLKLSPEEKLSLLNRYIDGESITKITSEYGISRTIFYKWLKKYKSSRKIRLEKRLDLKRVKNTGES